MFGNHSQSSKLCKTILFQHCFLNSEMVLHRAKLLQEKSLQRDHLHLIASPHICFSLPSRSRCRQGRGYWSWTCFTKNCFNRTLGLQDCRSSGAAGHTDLCGYISPATNRGRKNYILHNHLRCFGNRACYLK